MLKYTVKFNDWNIILKVMIPNIFCPVYIIFIE